MLFMSASLAFGGGECFEALQRRTSTVRHPVLVEDLRDGIGTIGGEQMALQIGFDDRVADRLAVENGDGLARYE